MRISIRPQVQPFNLTFYSDRAYQRSFNHFSCGGILVIDQLHDIFSANAVNSRRSRDWHYNEEQHLNCLPEHIS
jgi:hypothetical protein